MKKMYFLGLSFILLFVPTVIFAQDCANDSERVVAVYHIYSIQQSANLMGHVAHDACYNSAQSRITLWGTENILMCWCARSRSNTNNSEEIAYK
jgi:hypothetical protein